jgi:hypothetical protein
LRATFESSLKISTGVVDLTLFSILWPATNMAIAEIHMAAPATRLVPMPAKYPIVIAAPIA